MNQSQTASHDLSQDLSHGLNAPGQASLKRRWLYLLPAVFVTYSLAYLDRANYGFGAAAGLAATLHITGSQSSLLGAIFFFGYFCFQVPGAILARRRSATRLVFASLIVWGILAALTGVVRQFWVLALDRFLLGIAESFIFPAMLLLLTRWFTRSERSRANTILILGNPITVLWMSAITGYLIQAVGWQRTFIYEGIPSVIWAIVWLFLVKDTPAQSSWMTPEATAALESRITQEQLSVSPIKNVRAALLRGDVILLSIIYFLWSVGVYGFVIWLPAIVQQGSALSMGRTGLLSAVPYLAAIFAMLFASWRSDKTLRRAALVTPFLFASGLAMLVSFTFSTNFPIAFAGLVVAGACMYAPYGPFFALIPERVPRNVTAEVIALINSCGALGAFFGSYLVGWLRSVTGDSRAGFLLMALSLVASAGLMLLLKPPAATLTTRENAS
ncbi:MFS transporter [Granulicella sibirica]|uniref:2-ketogluconate transporter n=1 Tax=Granulicella sibirica TaxID=2479048 RepID=A0A4Q0T9I5_9BACT|nr:MFS transporter [Granulicella sibirica]RXH58416.1 2-ketogluconate transporter [Granulicella sibirica]